MWSHYQPNLTTHGESFKLSALSA